MRLSVHTLDICHETFSSHSRMDLLMIGAGIIMINVFLKKFVLYFIYPSTSLILVFDSRFVKHAFMIYLSMFIMDMYMKTNSGF